MGSGPLNGIKIVEFAGIGPGPFCAMLLSDMGAEIIRIDRKGSRGGSPKDIGSRGRKSVALDLKNQKALKRVSNSLKAPMWCKRAFAPASWNASG